MPRKVDLNSCPDASSSSAKTESSQRDMGAPSLSNTDSSAARAAVGAAVEIATKQSLPEVSYTEFLHGPSAPSQHHSHGGVHMKSEREDAFPLPPHPTKVRYAPPAPAHANHAATAPTTADFHPSPTAMSTAAVESLYRVSYPPQTVTPRDDSEEAAKYESEEGKTSKRPFSSRDDDEAQFPRSSRPCPNMQNPHYVTEHDSNFAQQSLHPTPSHSSHTRSGFLPPPHDPQPHYSHRRSYSTKGSIPPVMSMSGAIPSSSSSSSHSFGHNPSKSSSWEDNAEQHAHQQNPYYPYPQTHAAAPYGKHPPHNSHQGNSHGHGHGHSHQQPPYHGHHGNHRQYPPTIPYSPNRPSPPPTPSSCYDVSSRRSEFSGPPGQHGPPPSGPPGSFEHGGTPHMYPPYPPHSRYTPHPIYHEFIPPPDRKRRRVEGSHDHSSPYNKQDERFIEPIDAPAGHGFGPPPTRRGIETPNHSKHFPDGMLSSFSPPGVTSPHHGHISFTPHGHGGRQMLSPRMRLENHNQTSNEFSKRGNGVITGYGGASAASTPQSSRKACKAELYFRIPPVELIPVYAYSTEHRNKSWEEMVRMFGQFVERLGHGDVERNEESRRLAKQEVESVKVDRDIQRENAIKMESNTEQEEGQFPKEDKVLANVEVSVDDDETHDNSDGINKNVTAVSSSENEEETPNDENLTLLSWVREIRWLRRAQGGENDRKPFNAHGKSNDDAEDDNLSGAETEKEETTLEFCDSETLTKERVDQLDKLGFPWRNQRSAWSKWLDDLLHYKAKNNGCVNVPLKYAEYPSLGNFVNRQRTEYRKLMQGKSSSMTQTKILDLERVGFLWSVREGGHTSWESRLAELIEYQVANGNCNVPKCYPPNPSLGYWVNEQRFQYRRLMKGKSSYMTQRKINHLNSIGFVWTLRESKRPWSDWLEELKVYKAEHGHVDVPLKYEKNVPLGAFVNNQRSEYRKLKKGVGNSSMTEEKIRDLEALGFQWSVREGRTPWAKRLEELKEYREKHGNSDVPTNYPENQPLSYWVSKQRQQYRLYGHGPCHLTEDRINALNELDFDWRCVNTAASASNKLSE